MGHTLAKNIGFTKKFYNYTTLFYLGLIFGLVIRDYLSLGFLFLGFAFAKLFFLYFVALYHKIKYKLII